MSRSIRSTRRSRAAFLSSVELLEKRLQFSTLGYSGGTYTQNFDSLIPSGSVSGPGNPLDLNAAGSSGGLMSGWGVVYAASGVRGATSTTPRFSANDGSGTVGSAYSYGTGTNTERALGTLSSASDVPSVGLTLMNNTGSTIKSVSIAYDGETWRIGGAVLNTLSFGYEVGGTLSDADSAYTLVPALNYAPAIQSSGNNASTNGNTNALKQTNINAVIPGISWAPGAVLNLRWNDTNEVDNDYGLAIDNFSFGPGPTSPGTLSFTSSTYSGAEPTNAGGANTGTTFVNLTVQRTGGADGAALVDYAITGSSATQGTDYLAPAAVAGTSTTGPISGGFSGTISFLDQQTTATISVPIVDDSTAESAENFSVAISDDASDTSHIVLGSPLTATGTIYDNDGTAPNGVLLNELDINPPGDSTATPPATDGPNEYVEVINSSGTTQSINDLWFISVEGDAVSNTGNVTYAEPLSGMLSSGNLAVIEASTGGPNASGAQIIIHDPLMNPALGALQNGTNTFMLVYSQLPITVGTDLDPTHSSTTTNPAQGTLTLPTAVTVLDSVGWHDTTTGVQPGTIYGDGSNIADLTTPEPNTVTGAASRIPGANVKNTAADWYYGELYTDPVVNSAASLTYDLTNASTNIPTDAVLTPGTGNYTSPIVSGEIGFTAAATAINESVSSAGMANGSVTITIGRVATTDTTDTVTADYLITPGTATQGTDYGMPAGATVTSNGYTGTLTFAGSASSATIVVPIFNDSIVEPTEAFTITLSNPKNLTTTSAPPVIGIRPSTTVNIGDNDTHLLLNEILANVPFEANDTGGVDSKEEFVELLGTPGQFIPANTYFVSVEGDKESTIGSISYAYDIGGPNGLTLPSAANGGNGLILLKSASNILISPPAPGTTIINDDTVNSGGTAVGFNNTSGALQNGTNSFLIVSSGTVLTSVVSPTTSSNLDVGKDGTLDLATIGASLVDGVGWTDGGSGDVAYGALLNFGGNNLTGTIAPAAGVRIPGTTDVPDTSPTSSASTAAAGDWYYGDLVGSDSTKGTAADDRMIFANDGTAGNINNGVFTSDANEHLTPGELNYNTKPFLDVPATFNYDNATGPNITLDYSSNVQANFVAKTTLTNLGNSSSVAFNTSPATAAAAFTNGYVETVTFPGTTLPDGNYELKVASGLSDDFTLQTNADLKVDFFSLAGDANHDRIVNALDFNALATHYGQAGTFSQGNFDYTGTVGSSDFDILANNFGKVLAPPPGPGAVAEALPAAPASLVASPAVTALAAAANPMSLFSSDPITGSLLSDIL